MDPVIDFAAAERIGRLVAREPEAPAPRVDLDELAVRAQDAVASYTGLTLDAPLPAPEAIDRGQWIDANVENARGMLAPLTERLQASLRGEATAESDRDETPPSAAAAAAGALQGALAKPAKAAAGFVLGAELGLLLGTAAQRVLGQYDIALIGPDRPPRLLYVLPNLGEAARAFGVPRDELGTWITLHELTHAHQFGGVPWLRPHLASRMESLLANVDVKVDLRGALSLPGREDVARVVDALRSGDLVSVLAGERERAIIDELQAAMTLIEGHAEHVMDAAAPELLPSLPKLRATLERRRANQPPLARLLGKLLGLELKLRQYERGKRFCDHVVEHAGIARLNRAWEGPELLPTLAEIDDPDVWLLRTRVPAVTS